MTKVGISPASGYLAHAGRKVFEEEFSATSIKIGVGIDRDLPWVPELHFKYNKFEIIAAETSEKPYPEILRIRYPDLMGWPGLVTVYSICPEQEFLTKRGQREAKELKDHGFGLIVVDDSGAGDVKIRAVPIILFIRDGEFAAYRDQLPSKVRKAAKQALQTYKIYPKSGAQDVADIVEACVDEMCERLVKQGSSGVTNSGSLANRLDNIYHSTDCGKIRAEVAQIRGYIKKYRNALAHTPKTKKDARSKYQECRSAFLDGLKYVIDLKIALKNAGLKLTGKYLP